MMNLLRDLPGDASREAIESLLDRPGARLERIVSRGQATPPGAWYDQEEDEWVALLQGEAELEWAGGARTRLRAGDALLIQARRRHRVAWTTAEPPCVWLALFVRPSAHPTRRPG